MGFSEGLDPDARPAIEAMSLAIYDGTHSLFLGDTDGDIYERAAGADRWSLISRHVGAVSKVGHYRHVQPPAEETDASDGRRS
jgi:hypothetical protein